MYRASPVSFHSFTFVVAFFRFQFDEILTIHEAYLMVLWSGRLSWYTAGVAKRAGKSSLLFFWLAYHQLWSNRLWAKCTRWRVWGQIDNLMMNDWRMMNEQHKQVLMAEWRNQNAACPLRTLEWTIKFYLKWSAYVTGDSWCYDGWQGKPHK